MKHIKFLIFLMIIQQSLFVQHISAQKIDFTEMKELSYYLGDGFTYKDFSKHSGKYFTHREKLDSLFLFDKLESLYYPGSLYSSVQDSSVFNKKKMIVYFCRKSKGIVFGENFFKYNKKEKTVLHSIINRHTDRNGKFLPVDTINELYKYDNKNRLVERQITNSQGNRTRSYKYGYKNGSLSYIIDNSFSTDTLFSISIDTIYSKPAYNPYYKPGFATQLRVTLKKEYPKPKVMKKLKTRMDTALASIEGVGFDMYRKYYKYYIGFDQKGRRGYFNKEFTDHYGGSENFERYYKYDNNLLVSYLTINVGGGGESILEFSSVTFQIMHFIYSSSNRVSSQYDDEYVLGYGKRILNSNINNRGEYMDPQAQEEIVNKWQWFNKISNLNNSVLRHLKRRVKYYSYK